jgi:hypothetical protein
MTVARTFKRGVVVDDQGFFLAAVQWEAGTPKPSSLDLNGPRREGSTAPRLRLLTSSEAIADPVPGGKWDSKKKVWLRPSVKMWAVNTRRDLPRYGTLAGERLVWPERLPNLPAWQAWVTTPPPAGSRSRKPMYDFEAAEWIVPVAVVEFEEDGDTCKNIVVKPRLEDGDETPDQVEVTDEQGQKIAIAPGHKRSERIIPAYPKFSIATLFAVLRKRDLRDAFITFLDGKGLNTDDLREVGMVSLNNRLIREFVAEQGFTIKQAYNALQKEAETMEAEREERLSALHEEERG